MEFGKTNLKGCGARMGMANVEEELENIVHLAGSLNDADLNGVLDDARSYMVAGEFAAARAELSNAYSMAYSAGDADLAYRINEVIELISGVR